MRLLFEVEDTGVGIAADEIANLFEPFVQTKSGSEAMEGTGLGLPISRKYVSLMGGKVTAKSELGKGSIFSFDVRVTLADHSQVSAPKPRRRVIGAAPGQQRFRILIAEDRDSNRTLLMKMLEPLGLDVKGVRNGAECVATWETWEPHLIWMDMRMPVMDGYEATRRIKATAKGQATVIIAITASAFESDRKLILTEGCDDFVRKPFIEDEIFEKLEKHLGLRLLSEETAEPGRHIRRGVAPRGGGDRGASRGMARCLQEGNRRRGLRASPVDGGRDRPAAPRCRARPDSIGGNLPVREDPVCAQRGVTRVTGGTE